MPRRLSDSSATRFAFAGSPVDAAYAVADSEAELGCDDDALAPSAQRPADQLFVRVRPVNLGSVEKVDPEIERSMNRCDGLGFVRRTVCRGHPHAAEPKGRDGQTMRSKLTLFHGPVRRGPNAPGCA